MIKSKICSKLSISFENLPFTHAIPDLIFVEDFPSVPKQWLYQSPCSSRKHDDPAGLKKGQDKECQVALPEACGSITSRGFQNEFLQRDLQNEERHFEEPLYSWRKGTLTARELVPVEFGHFISQRGHFDRKRSLITRELVHLRYWGFQSGNLQRDRFDRIESLTTRELIRYWVFNLWRPKRPFDWKSRLPLGRKRIRYQWELVIVLVRRHGCHSVEAHACSKMEMARR